MKIKKCKCKIRGVVELYEIKDGIFYSLYFEHYAKWLRRFKYCPLCGKKLR